jgi:hypothetical protein
LNFLFTVASSVTNVRSTLSPQECRMQEGGGRRREADTRSRHSPWVLYLIGLDLGGRLSLELSYSGLDVSPSPWELFAHVSPLTTCDSSLPSRSGHISHVSCSSPSISRYANRQWFLSHGIRSTSNVPSSISPYLPLSLV